jgi:ATP-binding cassette, subfamily C (CFTR/MRP), member 1
MPFRDQLAWAIFVILHLVHYTLSLVLRTSTTRTTNISILFGTIASFGFWFLSHHDHLRSFRPSTILTVYLLFTIPMDAARARTLWSMPDNVTIAAIFTAIVVWKFLILLLEVKEKRCLLKPAYRSLPPEETGGIMNRSFFWWFNPLLLAGNKRTLSVQDLFTIDSDLSFKQKEGEMRYKWTKSKISLYGREVY